MLRPATLDDVPGIERVTRAGFEIYRAFAPPGWDPPSDMTHGTARRLVVPGTWSVVAVEEDEIAGFGAFSPARVGSDGELIEGLAHIWAVFVLEPFWGTGMAGQIMDALIERIAADGFAQARLYVAAEQRRARGFYRREGWHEAGEPVYEPRLQLDLVEMRRAV